MTPQPLLRVTGCISGQIQYLVGQRVIEQDSISNTPLTAKNNTAEEIAALEKLIPLGRMAQPQEIARLIYFLGSIENTYITGQKIIVDGGYTAQ